MVLVRIKSDVSTQSRVFISGKYMARLVTYIRVVRGAGYGRLEEGMVWRQSTGREGYGRWKDVRTPWSSLMLARCMESLQLAALSSCGCVGCMCLVTATSVRSYDPPIQLGQACQPKFFYNLETPCNSIRIMKMIDKGSYQC